VNVKIVLTDVIVRTALLKCVIVRKGKSSNG
jgi:hypothetical protein